MSGLLLDGQVAAAAKRGAFTTIALKVQDRGLRGRLDQDTTPSAAAQLLLIGVGRRRRRLIVAQLEILVEHLVDAIADIGGRLLLLVRTGCFPVGRPGCGGRFSL